MRTIEVCWTPGKSPDHSFRDGSPSGAIFSRDEIPIRAPTQLRFVAARDCSDSQAYPFTMKVDPEGDVQIVSGNGTANVVVSAAYRYINRKNPLHMHLINASIDFGIDSGKPIIRNDPQLLGPYFVPIGTGLVIVLLAVAYWLWRRRRA